MLITGSIVFIFGISILLLMYMTEGALNLAIVGDTTIDVLIMGMNSKEN